MLCYNVTVTFLGTFLFFFSNSLHKVIFGQFNIVPVRELNICFKIYNYINIPKRASYVNVIKMFHPISDSFGTWAYVVTSEFTGALVLEEKSPSS